MHKGVIQKRATQCLFGAAWLATMYLIFIFITIMTEAYLAPWDMISEQFRPDSGTWQYAVNRFFETGPGPFMIIIPLLLTSIFLTWRIVRKRWQSIIKIVIGNALYIVMLCIMPMIALAFNNALFGDPLQVYLQSGNYADYVATVGYHRSVLPLLLSTTLSSIWLSWLFYTMKKQDKQKRKRQATQPDTSRLAANDHATASLELENDPAQLSIIH
ncbi:hypothetical protein G4Y79_03830 [Phototrophicus methaneseepsis]|uniref:Uncharacterized protein n=1 Tax=Phototrophicus methaneseepsis TaxID=2710758 RepID=A0A7S8EAR3_9CHLR|nr:hypothetical protein [Phototrophicus methaneseepsis]QPC83523.1 hypothetical protein G4Y79_03830 [Phototrophicus methaneseepsis]